ncbi:MAG: hypothetical protein KC423_27865, partial [Anaerolineales bacterium]|nr:hypothetical protein [Anaerolineales bacterium]
MRKGLFVLLLLLGGCQPSPIEVTPTPELVVTSMFEGFGAVEEAETAVSTPTALPILPTQAVAEEETAVSASNTIRE